ncbi:MAG: hypothetical protein EA373_12630 [Oceanospirillales bacterium]|nr:MAG: hypothetical protein EA373_12630 [Oceanospirillales bacterium]
MFRFILLMMVVVIAGCSSIPSDLQTPDDQSLLPFSATKTTQPSNQLARWGGEVVSVNNLEIGSMIEVVEFSLNAAGRPIKSDTSGGRFRILVGDFIDPAIYVSGRQVTALGVFSSLDEDKVGDQAYFFPILTAEQLHLWPEIKEPSNPPYHYDPFFFHRGFLMSPIIVVPRH